MHHAPRPAKETDTVADPEPMTAGLRLLGRGPVALLHGDPHIGDTYVTEDGRTGFADWRCVLRGSWAYDVSHLLTGGSAVEDHDPVALLRDAPGAGHGRT
ncbi:phosphotransferase [Streptomyces viridosporus]|uniref:phosphotransferase n=1 Tax=Streptomyces viridosporus TaxID=67581 RepID=UPI001475A2D8|nr:phosphotransferase [Streptomyces viridosporus]